MSIEIHVLSDERLSSVGEWQRAIDAEGFGLTLSQGAAFESVEGFLPARLVEEVTGFECCHDDAEELVDTYAGTANIVFDRRWKHALSFRWGGSLREAIAAYMAATAYARTTNGIIVDPQDGRVMTPREAKEVVRNLEQAMRAS